MWRIYFIFPHRYSSKQTVVVSMHQLKSTVRIQPISSGFANIQLNLTLYDIVPSS
ncbi:hypothetical protein [Fusobacterium russii]|uniref:hypothetical protein n=1 Tax=Fusobacterium russii TaxID=854 RepID=UPI00164E4AAD|nr:hypothetical protein [Fusobacterium russii]